MRLKYRYNVLKKLSVFADGVKKFYAGLFLLAIISMLLNFLLPVFYGMFIEKVILGGEFHLIVYIIIGYLGIQLAQIIVDFSKNYFVFRLSDKVLVSLKEKILDHALFKNFKEYEKYTVGKTKTILEDYVSKLSAFADIQTVEYIMSYAQTVIIVLLLIILEWRMAIFALMTIPITIAFNYVVSKKEKEIHSKQLVNDQAWVSWLNERVQGWREVRVFNLEQENEKTFDAFLVKDLKLYTKWLRNWVTRELVLPKIKDDFFMQFALYFIGGVLIYHDKMAIGVLLVFVKYYSILSDCVNVIATTDANLQSDMPYYDAVFNELDESMENDWKGGVGQFDHCNIEFENVSFQYRQNEKMVLDNISFEIIQGERVGIIGESGGGKTTLLKLIAGMLRPSVGIVRFSDININEIDLKALYKKIGFVMQENALYNVSIRENLLYGKVEATQEEMEEACKRACISDYILQLPNGFDTVIGEKGVQLSGGQRQRLILARLFLRNVDVFIFDEATSALDQMSENEVQSAINGIGKDKTIIVVAHRASSLALCDRFIYV